MINGINDEVILGARLFLAPLFLIFGWRKLRDYPGEPRHAPERSRGYGTDQHAALGQR